MLRNSRDKRRPFKRESFHLDVLASATQSPRFSSDSAFILGAPASREAALIAKFAKKMPSAEGVDNVRVVCLVRAN